MQTICFICETPYQLLTAINCAPRLRRSGFVVVDLYIGLKFSTAERVSQRIREMNLFDHVCTYVYRKFPKHALSGLLYKHSYFCYPSYFIRRSICPPDEGAQLVHLRYNRVFVSAYTHFTMAMIMLNRKARISFYDDGLGSYVGKLGTQMISWKKRLVYLLTFQDFSHLYPPRERLLYNPAVCESEYAGVPEQLPKLDLTGEMRSVVEAVFGAPDVGIYAGKKIFYLTQPNYGMSTEEVFDSDPVLNSLRGYRCLVRPHPQQDVRAYRDFTIDSSGTLWELVSFDAIDNDSVLIAKCSTAQYIPKLLYGKEPWLLFTSRLYDYVTAEFAAVSHELYLQIRRQYTHAEKVIEVETIDQLDRFLRERFSGERK